MPFSSYNVVCKNDLLSTVHIGVTLTAQTASMMCINIIQVFFGLKWTTFTHPVPKLSIPWKRSLKSEIGATQLLGLVFSDHRIPSPIISLCSFIPNVVYPSIQSRIGGSATSSESSSAHQGVIGRAASAHSSSQGRDTWRSTSGRGGQ